QGALTPDHRRPRAGERGGGPSTRRPDLDTARRVGYASRDVPRSDRSPQSLRPGGVGDVKTAVGKYCAVEPIVNGKGKLGERLFLSRTLRPPPTPSRRSTATGSRGSWLPAIRAWSGSPLPTGPRTPCSTATTV